MGGDTSLYTTAAAILTKVQQRTGTVKSLCLTSTYPNKKKIFALVCETLRYASVVRQILELSDFMQLQKRMTETMALVLVYDELFGSGVRCGGGLQGAVAKTRTVLKAALARLKARAKVKENADLLPAHIRHAASHPRYIRVNKLKTTVQEVIDGFVQEGYTLLKPPIDLSDVRPKTVSIDPHLDDVLLVAPNTDFHLHPYYLDGRIIIQETNHMNREIDENSLSEDKASCMPAHALAPPPGAQVIDCCAAPGNKTSHVAAMVGATGKVFAFDIDFKRLQTLKKLTGLAGASSIIETANQSFLLVDPTDPKYSKVEYILLDPSCSGSGIVSRLDHLLEDSHIDGDENDSSLQARLENLADFQVKALLHAFKFPSVFRISYSTCSIHQQENEDVVSRVLQSQSDFSLVNAIPTFEGRGFDCLATGEGPKCLRVTPEKHYTNGFFVALFERSGGEQSNTLLKSPQESTEAMDGLRKRPHDDIDVEEGKDTKAVPKKKKKNKKKKNKKKVSVTITATYADGSQS